MVLWIWGPTGVQISLSYLVPIFSSCETDLTYLDYYNNHNEILDIQMKNKKKIHVKTIYTQYKGLTNSRAHRVQKKDRRLYVHGFIISIKILNSLDHE